MHLRLFQLLFFDHILLRDKMNPTKRFPILDQTPISDYVEFEENLNLELNQTKFKFFQSNKRDHSGLLQQF